MLAVLLPGQQRPGFWCWYDDKPVNNNGTVAKSGIEASMEAVRAAATIPCSLTW